MRMHKSPVAETLWRRAAWILWAWLTAGSALAGRGLEAGAQSSKCLGDFDADGSVTIAELVTATNNALRGCPAPDPTLPPLILPDLLPTTASALHCPGGCGPQQIEICVTNAGGADASAFSVQLNGDDVAELLGLNSGMETCFVTSYRYHSEPDALVLVDEDNQIVEDDEDNNVLRFPTPNPTACDVICEFEVSGKTPTPMPGW